MTKGHCRKYCTQCSSRKSGSAPNKSQEYRTHEILTTPVTPTTQAAARTPQLGTVFEQFGPWSEWREKSRYWYTVRSISPEYAAQLREDTTYQGQVVETGQGQFTEYRYRSETSYAKYSNTPLGAVQPSHIQQSRGQSTADVEGETSKQHASTNNSQSPVAESQDDVTKHVKPGKTYYRVRRGDGLCFEFERSKDVPRVVVFEETKEVRNKDKERSMSWREKRRTGKA